VFNGRLLLGPGPSLVSEKVLWAMSRPTIGHLDPEFIKIMRGVQDKLRQVFQTSNELTYPVSGTGTAGMETCLTNLIEPEDRVAVLINGVFGQRMANLVRRLSAGTCYEINFPWGSPIEPSTVKDILDSEGSFDVICAVHIDTSTGVQSDICSLGEIIRSDNEDTVFIVDAVTSLGGSELYVDAWQIDACFSGSQKCLSCPPGLAPVTFGPRALKKRKARKTALPSFYFDILELEKYWGDDRAYHHTAPVNMIYALDAALDDVLREGLENRWERHRRVSVNLVHQLEKMGIELLPTFNTASRPLTAVKIPEGVSDSFVRDELLSGYNIEIGGGLGELKGKVWRIGLMGESARNVHVRTLVEALEDVLRREKWKASSQPKA